MDGVTVVEVEDEEEALLALFKASSISCSLSPFVSKNSTFLLSGDSATLGSLRKLTALLIKSSFIGAGGWF